MGNFFPEELIEEIRSVNDVVTVISEYVVLKKKGRNYSGLCPFHHEKTPSFMVSPDKQIYHCFGCGAGGNVLKFVMQKENLTFPEALRMLAEKAGISLPENEDPYIEKRNSQREKAYEVNGLANEYFYNKLLNNDAGREALSYLLKRGTSRAIIDQFKLGYAVSSWDGLYSFLKSKGYKESDLAPLGVILPKERDEKVVGYYDRFRNRVMFPIMDIRGKVAGFGGRVMDDSVPKYLNSPETEVFNKSQLLFGLNFANSSIREKDQAIVMEGYMDVITSHQFGITNTVASLGTALTREQGKLLMRYTHNVVISYDADLAGVAATVRGLEILQELGCQVKVLTIPDGKDPDEFIKKQGPEAFQNLVDRAKSLIEYKLEKAMEKNDTRNVAGKLAVVGELFSNLKNIESRIQRDDAIYIIADKLHLSPEDIRIEYEKFIQNSRKKLSNRDKLTNSRYNNNMSVNEFSQTEAKATKAMTPREKTERELFRLLLEERAVFEKIKQKIGLDFFQRPEYIAVIKVLKEKTENDSFFEPSQIVNSFSEEEPINRLLTNVLLQEVTYPDINKAVSALIDTVKKIDTGSEKEKLLIEIAAAEKKGDVDLVKQLIVQLQTLL